MAFLAFVNLGANFEVGLLGNWWGPGAPSYAMLASDASHRNTESVDGPFE